MNEEEGASFTGWTALSPAVLLKPDLRFYFHTKNPLWEYILFRHLAVK